MTLQESPSYLRTMADQIRVLHVDDEPGLAEMASEFLEREDDRIQVETATDASEGLDRLDEDVDCVVSDYDMPGRNGIQFLESVRERYPDLPFILFTGKGSEEVASDAISAGVTDYLQKESGTDQYSILANRILNYVEKTQAQQERQRHLEAIETAQEGISILDEDGHFIYVNQAYADLYGYHPDELVGEHWELIYPDDDVGYIHDRVLPTVAEAGYWHGETTGLRSDGSTFVEDHILTTTERGELICTVRDVSDRRNRHRAIEDLHRTAQAVMRAETGEEIAELVVGALDDILDMPINGVWYHDEEEDMLRPVAWTEATSEVVGEPPAFTDGEGLAWEVFETGECRYYDDVSEREKRLNADTNIRSEILLPIGDHGIITVGATDAGVFDDVDVSLARTVATHTETALDRLGHERELSETNQRLEAIIEASPDPVIRLDTDGVVQVWNSAAEDVFGHAKDEALGKPIQSLSLHDGAQESKFQERFERVLSGETFTDLEVRRRTKDGDQVHLQISAAPTRDTDGTITGLVAITKDITDQKEREQALREERAFIDQTLDALNEVFYVVGTDGEIRRWNDQFRKVTNHPDPEIANMQATELFPEDERGRVREAIEETLKEGKASVEADVLTADGDRIPFELTGSRLTDADGELIGLVGIGRDITDRKEHERELEETNTVLRTMVDNLPMGVLVENPDRTVLTANETLCEILESSFSAEDLTGRNCAEAAEEIKDLFADPEGFVRGIDERIDKREQVREEIDLADGRTMERYYIPYTLPDGEANLWLYRDITERKRHERELQRRNERLDEFASVVSHDLRSPLSVAQGNLELARAECDSDHLADVARAHSRIETLIEDLLALAREGELVGDTEAVDLGDTVEECWLNVETSAATLVNRTTRTIQADRSRLQQLLENLLRNAVEHGGEDVSVTVGDLEEGFYVADDGTGISTDERERVFDAGYSTGKEDTGFGLDIVQRVADAHGWDISVTESETGGARFEITAVDTETLLDG